MVVDHCVCKHHTKLKLKCYRYNFFHLRLTEKKKTVLINLWEGPEKKIKTKCDKGRWIPQDLMAKMQWRVDQQLHVEN